MIMENLARLYDIIDDNRLVFRANASESDVKRIFETWKENGNTPDISIVDMSDCDITELRQPDSRSPRATGSLISEIFENLVEFIAPRKLETLGSSYFSCCKNLSSVKFDSSSNSLTKIEEKAFLYCDSLVEIALPESLKEIGDGAFKGCDSLEFLELGANIEALGEDSFEASIKMTLLDLSRCVRIKELKIRVSSNQVYLPVNLETLECSGNIEDLWVPPTLKRINYKTFGKTNIWCFSRHLTSLNQIEGVCYLCLPHSLAGRYEKIKDTERCDVKIFDFGEDGSKKQDYFWI